MPFLASSTALTSGRSGNSLFFSLLLKGWVKEVVVE
jgi:hypothetical protein